MSQVKDSSHRCAACGKVIEPNTPFKAVWTRVAGPRGGTKQNEHWGDVHDHCFGRVVGTDQGVLPVLRRLAREKKTAQAKAAAPTSTATAGA